MAEFKIKTFVTRADLAKKYVISVNMLMTIIDEAGIKLKPRCRIGIELQKDIERAVQAYGRRGDQYDR